MSKEMSRRDLLKMSGLAAAGVAGASLLGGCAPKAASSASDSGKAANGGSTAATTAAGHERAGLPSFLSAPEPIKDVKYDVVIVGAGAAGIPAAITAKEAGASVAVIQKESTAISQGNTATGILLDKSDPAGVEAVVSKLISEHDYRAKREQVELWAKNSGEAITWLFNLAQQCGAQVSDTTKKWTSGIAKVNDYEMNYLSIDFGPKPYNTGEGMKALAEYAEKQGVDFFYSTEAKQLVGDASGITGVIAKGAEGNIQFNAKKGVILAAGDYQNDDEMVNYYLPDLKHLGRKQTNKTGDGHKMAIWAGGAMEDLGHTKMLHDFDAGPGSMCDMPFLAVKMDGTRFCDETCGMSLMNNFLRSDADQGNYCQDLRQQLHRDGCKLAGQAVRPGGHQGVHARRARREKGRFRGARSQRLRRIPLTNLPRSWESPTRPRSRRPSSATTSWLRRAATRTSASRLNGSRPSTPRRSTASIAMCAYRQSCPV